MITMQQIADRLGIQKKELNKILIKKKKFKQTTVSDWWTKGLPAKRQIELVRMFKLDSDLLIKK